LLQGVDKDNPGWKIPLQIRSGSDSAPNALLLTRQDQTAQAGRCDEPLSANAGALGFYRTRYDAATLAINTKNFGRLKDSDRIALLDDQWALVESGVDPLPTYLALAAAMGSDLDTRAWIQIASALAIIEYAERGAAGHEAYAVFARSLLKPVFEQLGWNAKPEETPAVQTLRRNVIRALGTLGDPGVIDEARKRFAAFLSDHKSISPDNQGIVLYIVAQYADAAAFASLHAVARAAQDETQMRRYYSALMAVRDPILAQQAAQIALSAEIPPQADSLRLELLQGLAGRHQRLSWQMFIDNSERLLKPFATNAPLIVAQYVPEAYWNEIPLAEVEAWVRGHVPAEFGPNVDRGMEGARFRLAEKGMLVRDADAYLQR
jgi:aminopeptidase N